MVFLKTSLADLIRSLEATAPACGRPQPRAHPAEVLRDMPSLGLTTANKIQTIVGDGAAFPLQPPLAAYYGRERGNLGKEQAPP